MFYRSEFNGDISRWDVSSVISMNGLFHSSKFNGNISRWDISSVESMNGMFYHSKIAKVLNIEFPTFDEIKRHFLVLELEANLQKKSVRQKNLSKVRL